MYPDSIPYNSLHIVSYPDSFGIRCDVGPTLVTATNSEGNKLGGEAERSRKKIAR